MTLSCSEILSIYYLASVTIVSCFDYGQGDGSKDNAFEQNRNVQQNRPSNVAADLIHNKDAEDVASFKKLIGEAKQIFKDSEDECERSQDNHGAGNHFNLFVYASSKVDSSKPDTSKGSSSSSIVLLGDIFNVRDVVPDHDKFNDKISWVHLVSDNYKMDLILTAKDRPFSILPSDRFAVTFREDSKFIRGSKLPFRPGSFDAVMNGTLYKTLVSDNSIHPTKSVDILYISFGDSFLKLRAASAILNVFSAIRWFPGSAAGRLLRLIDNCYRQRRQKGFGGILLITYYNYLEKLLILYRRVEYVAYALIESSHGILIAI